MNTIKVNESLNLRGVPCPANSAKTIVKLEMMDADEVLEVFLDDGEPIENVPESVEEEGFTIIEKAQVDAKTWKLLIQAL